MRRIRLGVRDLQLLALLGLVLLIGSLGYVAGPRISLTLLYLVPVVAAGWFLGRDRAIAVALVAGAVSFVEHTIGPASSSSTAAFVWNAVSRTVILSIAAIAVARIRRDRERLLTQNLQRARSLELLDHGLSEPAKRLVDLAESWDGSVDDLKQQVRQRADEITVLTREFSSMVRLASGELPLRLTKFDFVQLIAELRSERQTADRPILMSNPASELPVRGDRARIRLGLDALISQRANGDELSLLVERRGDHAELVITSRGYRPPVGARDGAKDDLGLSVELAQLLFAAQGGSVQLARNALTRSLRVTARLPLA